MKHCTNCGHELAVDAKFCPHCGQATVESGQGKTTASDQSERVKAEHTENPHVKRTNQENQGQRATPRIPNGQSAIQKQLHGKNNLVIIAIVAVVIILGGFLFVKNRVVVSRDQLASNVTKAVQKEDGKLFLKQFSKDEQNLKFSDVGAQSVVKDIHNHSRDSLSEVGRIITDGQTVAGTEVKYHFNVESKKVLGMFTSYYLTTRRTPVRVLDYTGSGGPVTIKLKDADNQRVSKQQLSGGFFPGKYNFDVRSGDTQGDYWIWAAGDGDTIDLTLTSDD